MINYNSKLQIFQSNSLNKFPNLIHGFTTRQTNLQQLQLPPIIFPHQIHGNTVYVVKSTSHSNYSPDADAIVTRNKNIAVGIKTADCVPILLYEPRARIIGAVHAGWRGSLLRVTEQTIDTIETLGGMASNIIAAIGPSIGMCCYEVSDDLANEFGQELGDDSRGIARIEERYHLNLPFLNYMQLIDCSLRPDHIDYPFFCTSCQSDLFFSYRRERDTLKGQMVSFIQLLS